MQLSDADICALRLKFDLDIALLREIVNEIPNLSSGWQIDRECARSRLSKPGICGVCSGGSIQGYIDTVFFDYESFEVICKFSDILAYIEYTVI